MKKRNDIVLQIANAIRDAGYHVVDRIKQQHACIVVRLFGRVDINVFMSSKIKSVAKEIDRLIRKIEQIVASIAIKHGGFVRA